MMYDFKELQVQRQKRTGFSWTILVKGALAVPGSSF